MNCQQIFLIELYYGTLLSIAPKHRLKQLAILYIRYGKCNHTSRQCIDRYLPTWKQTYLKEIVFKNLSQIRFVSFGVGQIDNDSILFKYASSFFSNYLAKILVYG